MLGTHLALKQEYFKHRIFDWKIVLFVIIYRTLPNMVDTIGRVPGTVKARTQ